MGSKKDPKRRKLGSKSEDKSVRRRGTPKPTFPAADIHYLLTKGKSKVEVKPEVSLFLSSAEEYLMTEILEEAGNHATSRRSKSIEVQDVVEAIQADEELNQLLGDMIKAALSAPK